MSQNDTSSSRAIVADSAEEYTDKSRLRSLFEARDEAAASIRQASIKEQQFIRGKSSINNDTTEIRRYAKRLANEWVYENVVAYVIECEPLLRNSVEGGQLLEDRHLQEWHITGSDVGLRNWEVVTSPGTVKRRDNRVTISIVGVEEYLESPDVITHHWETTDDINGRDSDEETVTWKMDRRVSEDVFRKLNVLMADLGIGLEAEQDDVDNVAEYDYSDLI